MVLQDLPSSGLLANRQRTSALSALLGHTFAVQRVLGRYEEWADVHALLPHLSVYLGQVRPQES
jgi:hypothetical protein